MSTKIVISPRLQTALDWASKGYKVFPLQLGTKDRQVLTSWKKEASNDPATIRRWWALEDRNVACKLEGDHSVADADGFEGLETWVSFDPPETLTVRTPGGGKHFHLVGALGNSVRKFGPGFDTRGEGGYVLLPHSIVDGREYVEEFSGPIAPVPEALARAVRSASERPAPPPAPDHIDPAEALFQAREWMKLQPVPAPETSDHETYRCMAKLYDFGMDYEQRIMLIDDAWPGRKPLDELQRISRSIVNGSIQNPEPGTSAGMPASRVFEHFQAPPVKRSIFYLEDEDEQERSPRPAWLLPKLIPEHSTVLLYSGRGAGKSLVALDWLLSIATGLPTIFGVIPERKGVVVYAALEGLRGIKTIRRQAWRAERNFAGKIDNFFVCRAPMIKYPEQVAEFVTQIKAQLQGKQIEVICLDTVAKVMTGLDSVRDAGLFVAFCDNLVSEFHCSVVALGHTGKDESKGHRGGSEFGAGMGSEIFLKGDHKFSYTMRVEVLHHKDNEAPSAPWYFISEKAHGTVVLKPSTYEEYHKRTASKRAPPPVDLPLA